MMLHIYLKRILLIPSPLSVLARWPNQPTIPPLLSAGPSGHCPSFPSAPAKLARSPLFLGRPTGQTAARAPSRLGPLTRGARALHHCCVGP
jgi:hypothetical protein